jgi:hypothetical protein
VEKRKQKLYHSILCCRLGSTPSISYFLDEPDLESRSLWNSCLSEQNRVIREEASAWGSPCFQKLPLVLRTPIALIRRTKHEYTNLAWLGVQIPVSQGGNWVRKELEETAYNLSRLSEDRMRDIYRRAYRECRIINSHTFPPPRAMRGPVQWKQLRKWREP